MAGPPVVVEAWSSRSVVTGPEPQVELKYVIVGTDDGLAARDALLSASPLSYDSKPRIDGKVERLTEDCWSGTVSYHFTGGGNSGYTFDTGGGTQRITQSYSTSGRYPAGGDIPDRATWESFADPTSNTGFSWTYLAGCGGEANAFRPLEKPVGEHIVKKCHCKTSLTWAPYLGGLIGVTKDNVEGVDVTVPAFQFTISRRQPNGTVSQEYQLLCSKLTGCVNGLPWRNFAAGECLFLGLSGGQEDGAAGDWNLNYKFAGSPNRADIVIRSPLGNIGPVEKQGWEYLWIRYLDRFDPTANALAKIPVAAYVESVYPYADFTLLGLGS